MKLRLDIEMIHADLAGFTQKELDEKIADIKKGFDILSEEFGFMPKLKSVQVTLIAPHEEALKIHAVKPEEKNIPRYYLVIFEKNQIVCDGPYASLDVLAKKFMKARSMAYTIGIKFMVTGLTDHHSLADLRLALSKADYDNDFDGVVARGLTLCNLSDYISYSKAVYGITKAPEISGYTNIKDLFQAYEKSDEKPEIEKGKPKPPIGLRPRKIADEARIHEINAAICRYSEAMMDVPVGWYQELHKLTQTLYPES